MTTTTVPATEVNLSDTAFYITEDFHPYLAELRARGPVHWTQAWPDRGFWSVVRHKEIKEIGLQPILFSCEQVGNVLPPDPHMYDTPEGKAAGGIGLHPTFVDPPRHDIIRKSIFRPFEPKGVIQLESEIQRMCDYLIDGVIERGECDFVKDIASKLPIHVICSWMGAPREDWDRLLNYVNAFFNYSDPDYQLGPTPADTMKIGMTSQFEYVREQIAERRRRPKDDMFTLMSQASVDGEVLSLDEASWWTWSILTAGFETVRASSSYAIMRLSEDVKQQKMLIDDPKLGKTAANEFVRMATPAHSAVRVAMEDTEVGGQRIRAGDWVVIWMTSGNRDELVFDKPNLLDITRSPNPHLGFGWGTHVCLGRHLGILEVSRLVRTALMRLENIEINGEIVWTTGMAMGIKKLPIAFQPRSH